MFFVPQRNEATGVKTLKYSNIYFLNFEYYARDTSGSRMFSLKFESQRIFICQLIRALKQIMKSRN
jgi:hypothetical protein